MSLAPRSKQNLPREQDCLWRGPEANCFLGRQGGDILRKGLQRALPKKRCQAGRDARHFSNFARLKK
jgi:hypothetical protein